jgi:hypothetical protein
MQSGELWRKEDDEKSHRCQIDNRKTTIVLPETRIVRVSSGCRRFVLALIIVTSTVFVKYGTVKIFKS